MGRYKDILVCEGVDYSKNQHLSISDIDIRTPTMWMDGGIEVIHDLPNPDPAFKPFRAARYARELEQLKIAAIRLLRCLLRAYTRKLRIEY